LAEKYSQEGKTPILFSKNGVFMGMISVSDVLKDDSEETVSALKNIGIKPIMITGDNKNTARAIAKQVGIDDVISDVLPDEKANEIKKLQSQGKVMMVGDGINDALALTVADIGVAIGTGTDIAIESADVVLRRSSLNEVVTAIRISRKTFKNIKENLFWAFIYNVIGIPIAAGALIPINGIELNPMFGAAAMSLSSLCVVTNALRLNLFKENKNEKEKKMETILKIEGMMCPHCEGRVKNALESTEGVKEALVSHKKGEAVVKCDKDIPYEVLKGIIEAQGYKVL